MLREITIRGYRSCSDTHLVFRSPVTAIVGRNGVGKTTILSAIHWFSRFVSSPEPTTTDNPVGISFPRSLEAEFETDGVVYRYRFGYQGKSKSGRKTGLGLVESLTQISADANSTVFTRDGTKAWIEISKEYTNVPSNLSAIASLSAVLPEVHELVPVLDSIRKFLREVSFYRFGTDSDEETMVFDYDYRDWISKGRPINDVLDRITCRFLYLKQERSEILEELKSLLGSTGLGIIDDIKPTTIEIPASDDDQDSMSVRAFHYVHFVPGTQIGGAGQPLLFWQLSQGTQRIVATILSLLSENRSLILLEQPEDSIHSSILQKFVGLLRTYSADQQLIFSTHSSDVLNILKADEILMVTAPEGRTSVRSLSSDEMIIARSYLRNDGTLAEFLQSVDSSDDS